MHVHNLKVSKLSFCQNTFALNGLIFPKLYEDRYISFFQIDCQFYTSELISLLLQTNEDDQDHQQMIQLNYSLMEPYLVELKFSSFNQLNLDIADSPISTMSVFDFADQVGLT